MDKISIPSSFLAVDIYVVDEQNTILKYEGTYYNYKSNMTDEKIDIIKADPYGLFSKIHPSFPNKRVRNFYKLRPATEAEYILYGQV